jgi:leader peptidase (prepilin peptidase) / N-methyltransferase
MLVILFVLGAIVGSFLNVLALRFNSGLSLGGRSKCPHCGKTLRAYELIPVLSFFVSGGRCRGCKARISWQYPLVELWTGLIFMTVFDPALPYILNVLLLAVFSLYVAITVYDFRHKIIPDRLVYAAIIISALFRVMDGGGALDYFAGIILAIFFAAVWLFSGGRAMGFGDAKLALSVGFILGAAAGFSAIALSFWIGAVVGLAMIFFKRFNPLSDRLKQITIKSEIPFAPFIVLGAWLALVFHLDLLYVSIF